MSQTHGRALTSGRARTTIIAAVLIGLVLFVINALTKAPHVDEGDLASAAAALLDTGHFAFPMSYYYMPGARTEYFVPPLYYGTLAGWLSIFGRSIVAYRLFHVCFWALLVVAWTQISAKLGRSRAVVVIAAVLLALNYDLINLGISRYDVACAALNAAAIAAFLTFRESRFTIAVLAANVFLALSAITHPNAIFGLLGCALFVVGSGDWRRIRVRHVALGLLPYALAFGGWALIVDGRWSLFVEQMQYGARSKHVELGRPVSVVLDDVRIRWIELFAGWRSGVPVVMRAKTVFLILWLAAAFRLLIGRTADSVSTGLRRALAVFTLVSPVLLAFTDSLHLQIYVINVVPQCIAGLAIVLSDMWDDRPAWRPLLQVGVAGLAVFGVVTIAYRARKMELQHGYGRVIESIRLAIAENDLVVGPSELGFGLGFAKHVRNDPRLTSIGTGVLPTYIVRSAEQGELGFPASATCERSAVVQDSVDYVPVRLPDEASEYRVFRRATTAEASDHAVRLRYCHASPSEARARD